MRTGHYQPIFALLQFRLDIPSRSVVASNNDVPLLRDVLYRLFVSHVLPGEFIVVNAVLLMNEEESHLHSVVIAVTGAILSNA